MKKFERIENDSSAIKYPRFDLNDNPCSILKISSKEKNLVFEGNVIGEPEYHGDEIWVYVPLRSSRIRISHERYGVLRYEYPKAIESCTSYNLTLKFVKSKLDDKIRTLVMPILGVSGGSPSYGAMIGIVKKTGFYIKYLDSFGLNIYDEGEDIDESEYLFTGRKKQEWKSLTGGVIQRVWKPIYVYMGVGAVMKYLSWEAFSKDLDMDGDGLSEKLSSSKEWNYINKRSYVGFDVEIGGVYRYRNIAATVALQTGGFKTYQMNFGIGIMY